MSPNQGGISLTVTYLPSIKYVGMVELNGQSLSVDLFYRRHRRLPDSIHTRTAPLPQVTCSHKWQKATRRRKKSVTASIQYNTVSTGSQNNSATVHWRSEASLLTHSLTHSPQVDLVPIWTEESLSLSSWLPSMRDHWWDSEESSKLTCDWLTGRQLMKLKGKKAVKQVSLHITCTLGNLRFCLCVVSNDERQLRQVSVCLSVSSLIVHCI